MLINYLVANQACNDSYNHAPEWHKQPTEENIDNFQFSEISSDECKSEFEVGDSVNSSREQFQSLKFDNLQ